MTVKVVESNKLIVNYNIINVFVPSLLTQSNNIIDFTQNFNKFYVTQRLCNTLQNWIRLIQLSSQG